jgi:hypothetical protein
MIQRLSSVRPTRYAKGASLVALSGALCWLAGAAPALAQDVAQDPVKEIQPAPIAAPPADPDVSQTDIFSKDTVSVLLDARLVVANGATSFVNGGFGKTRFQGDADGHYKARLVPVEADLVWVPRFTSSLSANVSVAAQRDHDNTVGLVEAFVNYLPARTGPVGVSARAGLMWPEISLEHSTGGAWSVVNTITPSAINAWVGEEVRVLGGEGSLHASVGQSELTATVGLFGYNDTSGTLLSFRGWALHDEKGTADGYFKLPPLNPFITLLQQDKTKSTSEIDHKIGFYGRLDWRPPQPWGVSVFYYDNEGDPEAFTAAGQWGWRTRFWNVGFNADLGPNTKLLAQGMTGSTIMGFEEHGERWVHTKFQSAYVLVTQMVGDVAVTGRVEAFSTDEHGSEMSGANSEDGWALTAAARVPINDRLTAVFEALNVRSSRSTRVDLGGLSSPLEGQTVFQASMRLRL